MKDNKSQENKNMEAQASAVVTMTTEEFHRLLEENTRKQNELRTKRQEKLAALHMAYDQSIDAVIDHEHQATDDFRKSRAAFEEHKQMYDIKMRKLSKARNEIGREYQQGKAQLTNEMTILNEQLQSERHDIFERYRKSGATGCADAFRYMGCHCADGGVVFRVWAPKAESVSVVGDFNFWNEQDLPMRKISDP